MTIVNKAAKQKSMVFPATNSLRQLRNIGTLSVTLTPYLPCLQDPPYLAFENNNETGELEFSGFLVDLWAVSQVV